MTRTTRRAHVVPITSLAFFSRLRWIDRRPLLDTIEPYRRALFARALDARRPDASPEVNLVLAGRGKKNWKSADLVLAALYKLVIPESAQGNDGLIVANDEGQAGDDLSLAKKLIAANADLARYVRVLDKEIRRRDGRGSLQILSARDAIGAHGKTALFVGFDEIHGLKNWDMLEALAPDPTRPDTLTWITSYDTLFNRPGVPLFDLKAIAKRRADPRMLVSWYSADWCTDPALAGASPEERANPSMGSWPEGRAYIEQQRARLPTHKFRRLHLNLPGAPDGAFLDQGAVLAAVAAGRRVLPPDPSRRYFAFVDMSGGSSDDATLAIGHDHDGVAVLDLAMKQSGEPPFNPRHAVERFAAALGEYGVARVTGDNYAGETFKADFEGHGVAYASCRRTKTELYEAFEPALNAGEVELLDLPVLQEQLLTLVVRGARIDHQPGDHDDFANAAAGAVWLVRESKRPMQNFDIGAPVQVGAGRTFDITREPALEVSTGWLQ